MRRNAAAAAVAGSVDPAGFILFDDSSLLIFYCQAAAAIGLVLPLYLLVLQEALGGLTSTLIYGLRGTGAASAFLFLVHFICSNVIIRMPRLAIERRPMAPLHAQHALSLLFTTHQMHAVQAAAVAYHGRSRFDAQPPALSALMAAAHLALLLLARAWGATRLTWTAEGAARAIYGRPQGTSIAIAKACRYFIAFVFWLTYTWHAAASFAVGRPLWHAAAGSLAFGGAWLHAAVMWRRRRRLAAEAAADKDE